MPGDEYAGPTEEEGRQPGEDESGTANLAGEEMTPSGWNLGGHGAGSMGR